MAHLEFLTAVLPSQGKYCAFTMRDKLRKNIFVDDLDNLYETNLKLSNLGQNTFYALSAFDNSGTREAVHAQSVRSLFIDLDCGEGKAYPNKKAAVAALQQFIEDVGIAALGAPWLVDSGGGVHVYWPLTQDAEIAEWKPVAESLKRAARALGLNIDMTVTADAARVLRMPGTTNYKYTPPKPVLLRNRGDYFDLQALAAALVNYAAPPAKPPSTALTLPGKPPSTALTATAKAMMGNSITLFKNILVRTINGTGCAQVQHYIDHATEDGMEPIWRGGLSWAKYCDDADKAVQKLSSLHPYSEERTQQKVAEIKGPYPCTKMDSENPGICPSCPHWGKITNPLILGREMQTVVEASVAEPTEEQAFETPQPQLLRPAPPKGFEYGRRGGVFYRKPAEKEDEQDSLILLTPYDFFMTRMFRDGASYQAEFKVVKGSRVFTFAVPTKDITSAKDCIKVLATNNVIANTAGCDGHLYQYVRQSMQAVSASGEEVDVPPRFGWQEDGNFAVHDTVISAQTEQQNYTFVSDRLSNLISATQPIGTLENWQSVFNMMRRKAANDPVVWGHLAVAGIGFGSILMHFTPRGSQAGVMHLCSKETGAGKTLAQAMAVSVWGDPVRYLVAPSTSERTMMQRAGMLGSLPLCVDEITSNNRELNREWLPKFIFDYAAGMHKLKGSASGNTEIDHEMMWEAVAIITSNTPGLEAMMGARKHTSEGEAHRHLEWNLPEKYKLQWTDEEHRVRRLLSTNNGHAGIIFAQWCALNQDTVRRVVSDVTEHWKTTAGATDDERFWTAMAVTAVSGYVLAGKNYADIIRIPVGPIIEFYKSLVIRQRRIIAGNQISALDTLNAYIAEYIGSFVKTEGSTVLQHLVGGQMLQPSSSRQAVKGRVEYDVSPGHVDFFIEARLLKLHCAEHGIGYESFLKELDAKATVQAVRKNLLAGTKGPALKTLCLKITRTIADVEADT